MNDFIIINQEYFEQMGDTISPRKLQLNTTNTSDTKASFLDLDLSTASETVSTKIYDKWTFVTSATSCSVYISKLTRFARISSHQSDFNNRNTIFMAALLNRVPFS